MSVVVDPTRHEGVGYIADEFVRVVRDRCVDAGEVTAWATRAARHLLPDGASAERWRITIAAGVAFVGARRPARGLERLDHSANARLLVRLLAELNGRPYGDEGTVAAQVMLALCQSAPARFTNAAGASRAMASNGRRRC